MKNILILFFTFTITLAFANDEKPLRWQQLELEDRLVNYMNNYLSRILEKDDFYIHLKVNTRNQDVSLPKHNFKFKNKVKNSKFIKGSDAVSGGDLLALDKLGLFAPKFGDAEGGFDKEYNLKLLQYKSKIERDWSEKTNLFKFVDEIIVNIAFRKTVSDEKVKSISELATKALPNLGEIKFSIETYKVEFLPNKVALQKKNENKLGEFLVKSSAWGIILATIIASLTAVVLFAKYRKLKEFLVEAEAAQNENFSNGGANKVEKTEIVDPDFRPGSEQLANAILEQESGVDRFVLLLEKSHGQAITLVKKWIHLGSLKSKKVLFVLSERLSVNELSKIFSDLNMEEREKMSQISYLNFKTKDKTEAVDYISQQILEMLLDISDVGDDELQQLLVELSPKYAAEISMNNPKLGGALVNLMGVEFLSEMFKFLSEEALSEVSSLGISLGEDEIRAAYPLLKKEISSISRGSEDNNFVNRFVDILTQVSVKQELELTKLLIQEKKIDTLKEFSMMTVPASQFYNVPDDLLKNALFKLELNTKVEFLSSLHEEDRRKVLNKISQEGTKGRDLLTHAIETLISNQIQFEKVKRKQEFYFEQAVFAVRSYILALENKEDILESLSDTWLRQVNGDKQDDSLHLVA